MLALVQKHLKTMIHFKVSQFQQVSQASVMEYIDAELQHKLDRSENLLRHALEIDPRNGAYLDSMAHLKYRLGRYDEAAQYIERALARILPGDEPAVLYEHAGDIAAARGRAEEARNYFLAALKHAPENPERIRSKLDPPKGE